jgi:multiple sugar transport system permease protein
MADQISARGSSGVVATDAALDLRPDTVDGPASDPPAGRRRRGARQDRPVWLRLLALVALCVATVGFLYPLLWLVSAAFKPQDQVFDNRLIPRTFELHNISAMFSYAPVATWLLNSVFVGLAAAVAVTLSSALVAFGFAYFNFRGRSFLFGLVLATMMLPGAVTMIPVFLIWDRLGLVNTQVPLWAGNLFGSAFYIFLLRQFMLGIPRELFDAARVDGCGYFALFRRIALPLSIPALVIVFVFELQASWSDLMKPLIYLQDRRFFTLPRGLKSMLDSMAQQGIYHWEIVMATSLLSTLPMVLVFALAQRHIIAGVAAQGRKG